MTDNAPRHWRDRLADATAVQPPTAPPVVAEPSVFVPFSQSVTPDDEDADSEDGE